MSISKEMIWHFTCEYCTGYWSIATTDGWQPTQRKLFCPHCGKKQTEIDDTAGDDVSTFEGLPGQRMMEKVYYWVGVVGIALTLLFTLWWLLSFLF